MEIPYFSIINQEFNHGEEELGPGDYTVPDFKSELEDAKTFLQKASAFTGENLYDHLSDVLNKILAERPENVIDFFEEYSRKIKEARYKPLTDHLKDIYVAPLKFEYTSKIMPYLKPLSTADAEPSTADPEDEEMLDPGKRDLIQFSFYYEKAGIGFSKTEMYCLEISMRQLAKTEKLQDIRFWGKIFGLNKNYIIVESEISDEEMEARVIAAQEADDLEKLLQEAPKDEVVDALAQVEKEQEEYGETEGLKSKIPRQLPPLPVSQYKPPPETPTESPGDGVNKKVYYVCNEIGDSWIQLPDVTPQQIVIARQIIKYFTGNLDTEITTYPKFPGTEKHYLRAQIARISAGTQISPLGYFTFKGSEEGGEGEEEEEEEAEDEEDEGGASKTSYKINKRYEPHPMTDLTDSTMSFWVHHTLYVLPQGRTKWWNPNPKTSFGEGEELGEEEEEGDEGGAGGEQVEPETGPALLTPLSEDASLETLQPWSVRRTSTLFPEHAIAVVRSNLWPGAFTITAGKFFENIYIGTGHKHFAHNFSPLPLPYVQEEYPIGPEIMETVDPSFDQEEEWRKAHEKPEKPPAPEGEEEQEEEEEEDDEEEDDDD